jgi:Regulator of ribonuclease activity B
VSLLGRMFFRPRKPRDGSEIDQIVVKQLRSMGADLSQPRHVRHFIYFAEESDARAAARVAEEANYTATVNAPHDKVEEWVLVADSYRVIAPDTVAGFRAWFEQLASEWNGEYDGWEPATKP